MTSTSSTLTTQGPAYVIIDHSNVYFQGKNIENSPIKVDSDLNYAKLRNIILDGRELRIPLLLDLLLEKNNFLVKWFAKNHGKEKYVDTEIACLISNIISKAPINNAIILISGDGDFVPPLRRAEGREVEIWAWENGMSQQLKSLATKSGFLTFENVTGADNRSIQPTFTHGALLPQEMLGGILSTYEPKENDTFSDCSVYYPEILYCTAGLHQYAIQQR
ncbi:2663_t:CDS:2 [Funneliformis caledonium]|uniref:2663_t:CDS:1 n=1 Tax=Funneliformis caledonium TaxID=1117310 RepID=A0A9N9ASX0_9GLOM|nr:2663_t:CDS:2 [Funneliformis caledonium]